MKHSHALRIVRQTKANYNTIAAEWNLSRGRPSALKLRLIKPIKPGWRVLDLGCGNGFLAPEIVKRGAQYIGFDLSEQLIKIAKKKYGREIKSGRAKFVCGNALAMPFKDKSFNFIISYAVMHHIPSAELRLKFLKEISRVLEPGGEAIIKNWNLLGEWGLKKYQINEQLNNPKQGHDKGDVYIPWKATKGKIISRYLHLFSDKELKELAKKAGFKKIRLEYRIRSGALDKDGDQILKTIK